MKTQYECLPCFVRQAINASDFLDLDETTTEKVLKKVFKLLSEFDFSKAPGVMGGDIHRVIREVTGNMDPYGNIKKKYNNFALDLYPQLLKKVQESENPVDKAIRYAIAGNIIDFGVLDKVSDERVLESIRETEIAEIDIKLVKKFISDAEAAESIMYICDNSGEIVFDKFLLDLLPHEKITVVVKGGPVINDAILEDAEMANITKKYRVIDTGCDYPGVVLEHSSPEFIKEFNKAEMIISKGQANFECMNEFKRDIYFLLRVKCPAIAIITGSPQGSIVLKQI